MYIREQAILPVSNSLSINLDNLATEALVADLKIKEVRAIYPLVKAINSGRLTRNFTLYPAESLIGKNKADDPTGYSSFVRPYGKPILREHQAQNVQGLLGSEQADVPMGRTVFAGFKRRIEKRDGPATLPSKKYLPGTVEGDGTMYIVPAITDIEAIPKVLGGAYQTVSIGSRVENVWESISQTNIAELRRKGGELPPYERGQLYEGKLSYWRMGEIKGVELSFVNVPSDEYAGVIDPDIGVEGIRLLVAEKKSGKTNEHNFFDAKTSEKVELDLDESVWDESFFVDSAKVGHDIWWLKASEELKEVQDAEVTESAEAESSENDMKEINLETMSIEEISASLTEKNSEAVKSIIQNGISDLGSLKAYAQTLAEGEPDAEVKISNIELFKQAQDFVTKLTGTWDLKTAEMAIALFMIKEGTLEGPLVENDTPITMGALYLLSESNTNFKTEVTLSENVEYCGPDNTYPIFNQNSAVAAIKLLSESEIEDKEKVKETVLNIAKQYGIGLENETLTFYPIMVKVKEKLAPLFTTRSKEELDSFIENIDTFADCYGLEDAQKEVFAERMKTADVFTKLYPESEALPFELDKENLVHFLLRTESSEQRMELAALVGLLRKKKVSKKDIDEAYEAYNVFGTSVLRKFLEAAPSEDIVSQVEQNSSVETVPDPVAASEKNDGKAKESNDVWLGLRVRPSKRAAKSTLIKEKS